MEERFIEDKEVVTFGTKMFNIVSKNLEVLAEIPTLRVTNLNIGNTVTAITVDNFKILASIRAIGAEENSKTRTVKVYLSFNKFREIKETYLLVKI